MKKLVNEKAINGLYHSDHIAHTLLNELAKMPRQDETYLDELEKKLMKDKRAVPRRQLVGFFKRLEDFGVGELIVGRKGHATRFHWEVDSLAIARPDEPQPAQIPPPPIGGLEGLPISAGPVVLISHRFQLRPELVITVQLPSDITTVEADRLSGFLRSLPFMQSPV